MKLLGQVDKKTPLVCRFVIFLLFQEKLTVKSPLRSDRVTTNDETDFNRIRCPLCQWRPKPSHRWFCVPCGQPEYFDDGCGACWNTFSTRGRCPGCQHQWRWTACLKCAGWSRHEAWYEERTKL